MQISYIPTATISNVPKDLPGTLAVKEAVQGAIEDSIIIPIKEWGVDVIIKAGLLAEWGCIIGAAVGTIFYICGIKEGKKYAKICVLMFGIIQIVKVVFL